MTEITFRPIDKWPDGWRTPKERTTTPFRSTYSDTLQLLDDELYHLGAVTAHVQLAGITAADLRRDGRLRANTKVDHPGVVLTVVPAEGQPLVLFTDEFTVYYSGQGEAWQHNLRACVLGLRDLRRMTRYGLNGGDAQYAGFAALGPGGPTALGTGMTEPDAWEILYTAAGWSDHSAAALTPKLITDAYRDAARRLHPDRSDGDAARMAEVNRARDVLLAAGR